jgi:hypothetical protein
MRECEKLTVQNRDDRRAFDKDLFDRAKKIAELKADLNLRQVNNARLIEEIAQLRCVDLKMKLDIETQTPPALTCDDQKYVEMKNELESHVTKLCQLTAENVRLQAEVDCVTKELADKNTQSQNASFEKASLIDYAKVSQPVPEENVSSIINKGLMEKNQQLAADVLSLRHDCDALRKECDGLQEKYNELDAKYKEAKTMLAEKLEKTRDRWVDRGRFLKSFLSYIFNSFKTHCRLLNSPSLKKRYLSPLATEVVVMAKHRKVSDAAAKRGLLPLFLNHLCILLFFCSWHNSFERLERLQRTYYGH